MNHLLKGEETRTEVHIKSENEETEDSSSEFEDELEEANPPRSKPQPRHADDEKPTFTPIRERETSPEPQPHPSELTVTAVVTTPEAGVTERVISLMTTTTSPESAVSASGDENAPEGMSVIATPDRSMEVPDTADKTFIKLSDEEDIVLTVDDSDPDYEPIDMTSESGSKPEAPTGEVTPPDVPVEQTDAIRAKVDNDEDAE